ncbi:TRAP transporter small permease subunit [Nitrogeniibacter mangrovi]|uniref:TRAP transporter small permease protein n=1 Tax=Nitrogeniibacter mangrovi TaxID=2016596 RepID=A0A6C1B637_9RHOO|nr:TRAP transporter small permease subunit [Nitrogeniibacter mangrovi]QID19196.1 TRAP transporter small permease subunit [Nitrogeniibacter mangrovi]
MSDREFEAAEGRAISHDHPDDLHFLIHHAELPETAFSRVVDGALARLGRSISWAWIALMAVIVINVVMKNLFGEGRVEFEEIQWHIYAALFMLGLSVTLATDDHVRVDLFYGGFTLRTKAWIDLVGIVCLLLPFVAMLMWYGVPFVADSFATAERSSSPAGLPYRWIIKSALVAGIGLLGVAACARLTRIVALLFLGRVPVAKKTEA